MDLPQIGWHKDEKAETSETVITGRKRDERKAKRKEHKTRKEKEEEEAEETTTKQRVVKYARMIYVREQ